jgi:hypothetical protein
LRYVCKGEIVKEFLSFSNRILYPGSELIRDIWEKIEKGIAVKTPAAVLESCGGKGLIKIVELFLIVK